jgi:LysM repeat protein
VNGTVVPANEALIFAVVVSTPNPDGDVIHEVKAGQSLWQIAIDYEVKIDDIKRLNNLPDNNIYPGEMLVIKKDVMAVTETPQATSTLEVTASPTQTSLLPTSTISLPTSTLAPISVSSSVPGNNSTIMGVAIGIIALALLGSGIFTWLGNSKKDTD